MAPNLPSKQKPIRIVIDSIHEYISGHVLNLKPTFDFIDRILSAKFL